MRQNISTHRQTQACAHGCGAFNKKLWERSRMRVWWRCRRVRDDSRCWLWHVNLHEGIGVTSYSTRQPNTTNLIASKIDFFGAIRGWDCSQGGWKCWKLALLGFSHGFYGLNDYLSFTNKNKHLKNMFGCPVLYNSLWAPLIKNDKIWWWMRSRCHATLKKEGRQEPCAYYSLYW